ncbi:hypothetical protein GF389_02795 [Candidatus Dojkabacteria bacterium]|nr:hypothetical protein [Candidatus Dojkabacteria bacterium]
MKTRNRKIVFLLSSISILPFACIGVVRFLSVTQVDIPEYEEIVLEKEVSEDTNIVVFSDTHLTCKYDEKKDQYLKDIIEPADLVVINGDFWDYYWCDFDYFIEGEYQELFSMLKEREVIYIYGNHDLSMFSDERVSEFSENVGYKLELTVGDSKYYFEHGNKITPSLEEKYPIIRNKTILQIGGTFESIEAKVLGEKDFVAMYGFQKEGHKEEATKTMGQNEMLITGHIHSGFVDTDSRVANSGLIRHGFASYLEIYGGEVNLVKGRY